MVNRVLDTQRAAGGNGILDTQELGTGLTQVSSDLAISYAVRERISSDLAISYAVREQVSSDLAVSYAVRQQVSADLAIAYTVEGPGLISVSSDLAISYAVRVRVSSDLAISYSVLSDTTYARAPAGSGYRPRARTNTVRPPQIQE